MPRHPDNGHYEPNPTGTGKTHVATALGVQAIEHHRRKVRFFSTIELVNALEQEKAKGKAGQIAETLVRLDLLILDELGYLPFSASGGALLFYLLSKLYERTTVAISWKPETTASVSKPARLQRHKREERKPIP